MNPDSPRQATDQVHDLSHLMLVCLIQTKVLFTQISREWKLKNLELQSPESRREGVACLFAYLI